MKRGFILAAAIPDLEIFVQNVPMSEDLKRLVTEADFYTALDGRKIEAFRRAMKDYPITAATDPWSQVEYQSLYLVDTDPESRIILQEPAVKDPAVGVMVLKAARLRGESGMVYCGTTEQLKLFASKLEEYERRGEELNEREFLECLLDAAVSDGLKIIYHRLSPEHGGDVEDYD